LAGGKIGQTEMASQEQREELRGVFNFLAGTAMKYVRLTHQAGRRKAMDRHIQAMIVRLFLLGFLTTLCGESAKAAEQPFYSGKTITVVIGTSPGGTGGLRYTTVMKYLPKYIPGNPTIVAQYMAGAGGVAAAHSRRDLQRALYQRYFGGHRRSLQTR
jgi:hypothetical protein